MRVSGEMYVLMANELVIFEPSLKFEGLLKALRDGDFDTIDARTGLKAQLEAGFQALGEVFTVPDKYVDYVLYGGDKVSFLKANSRLALNSEFFTEAFCKMMRAMHDHWVRSNGDRVYEERVLSGKGLTDTTLANPCWRLVPFELLGWDRVKIRYLCLIQPILKDILLSHWKSVNFEPAYDHMAQEFADMYNLADKKAVKECFRMGKDFYPMWPEELSNALTDVTSTMTARLLTEFARLPLDDLS